jgi:hypothetical protein
MSETSVQSIPFWETISKEDIFSATPRFIRALKIHEFRQITCLGLSTLNHL